MKTNGNSNRYRQTMEAMFSAAAGGRDVIHGQSMGAQPRFFILGDEPVQRDIITGIPFSGPMNEILVKTIETLDQKYKGVTPNDCYATYLIKSIYRPGELTEATVTDQWVPACQIEYHLSGCSYLIPLGRVAKLFVGHILTEPKLFKPHRPSLKDKVTEIWRIARS